MKDKLRALLINPPITTRGNDSPAEIFFPMGLAYLAGVIEKEKKVELFILDALAEGGKKYGNNFCLAGLSFSEIKKRIIAIKPDVVGVTSMFTAYSNDAHDIAKIIKKIDRRILVIFGGSHASCNYDYVLNDPNVDFVIKGEGEETLLEFLRSVISNKNLKNIKGVIYRKGNKFIENQSRQFIQNLDLLSFPARHLFPMDKYLSHKSPYLMRTPVAGIITSRGCPGHCVYCSIHAIWGHSWRGRSAKNVVDEIEELVKNYGVREIAFFDDSASVNKKRWNEICDEIINRKIDIKWTTPNGIAHWTLDKPLLNKMKEAGCYRVTFGIESGNVETRNFLGKPYPLSQAKELIQHANKIGLWTICTNIIGFPDETKDQIEDTVKFAINSGTDFALFYPLTPFRGTPIYNIFKEKGLLLHKEDKELFITESTRDTVNFTKEEIANLVLETYKRFMFSRILRYLFNPLNLIRKIHSIEDFKYMLRLGKSYFSLNAGLFKAGRMGAKIYYNSKNINE